MSIKKVFFSWYSLIGFTVGMAISAVLWAHNEHEEVLDDCQERIDRACSKIDRIYAKETDMAVVKEIVERIEKKLDRLLELD